MKTKTVFVLMMLVTIFMMPLIAVTLADCNCNSIPSSKNTLNIQSQVMDIKSTFVDKEGILYIIDFDGKQEMFYNTSTSVILTLQGMVGTDGCNNVHLLYITASNGNCILVDAYTYTDIQPWAMLALIVFCIFGGILIGYVICSSCW